MKWKSVMLGVGIFLVGTIVGVAGSGAEVETSPAEVRTEEVSVTPPACREAIEAARNLMNVAGKMGPVTTGYIELIPRAMQAGIVGDIDEVNAITAEMEKLIKRTTALTGQIKASEFPDFSAECEAS